MSHFDPENVDAEANRVRIAYHEAGHAVVTWALGISLKHVQIDDRDGFSERAETDNSIISRLGNLRGHESLYQIGSAGEAA